MNELYSNLLIVTRALYALTKIMDITQYKKVSLFMTVDSISGKFHENNFRFEELDPVKTLM